MVPIMNPWGTPLDRALATAAKENHPVLTRNADRYRNPVLYAAGEQETYRPQFLERNPIRVRRIMLNSTNLGVFLTANVMKPLFDHYLLMTNEAQLLAYSAPHTTNINKYRDEAALVSQAWKHYDTVLMSKANRTRPGHENPTGHVARGELQCLTFETQTGVIIVRAIQPCLLLVQVGYTPPDAGDVEYRPASSSHTLNGTTITYELRGDARFPPLLNYPETIDFGADVTHTEGDVVETEAGETTEETATTVAEASTRVHSLKPAEDDGEEDDEMDVAVEGEPVVEASTATQTLNLQRSKIDGMADWLGGKLHEAKFITKPSKP